LSLIMHELDPLDDLGTPSTFTLRDLERLLHPRVPPLARALPSVESLCLFRHEESLEERELRELLHIATSPRHDRETVVAESQPPMTGPLLASLAPHPNSHTSANGGAFNTLAPVLLSPHSQPAALVDPKPSLSPTHTPNVSSSSQLQSQARHSEQPKETLRPREQESAPFISGDVEPSEETPSGARAEVIYLREDEDEDEEMPSIDMGSDSD